MSIPICNGGFAAYHPAASGACAGLEQRLRDLGAQVAAVPNQGPLLAAWPQFAGQGLWCGDDGALAYDLDLANAEHLRQALGGAVASDPGALLWQLYCQDAEGFLDHLRGVFAFALWDRRKRCLLVATDPYGVRPVVYAEVPDGLVVGSRIRHLRLHPQVPTTIDGDAVYQYLFYSAIPSPNTIYRGVRKLEPGRHLRYADGRLTRATHYDIRYRPDEAAGEFYWRRSIPLQVRRAVARAAPLSAPEETGCFLSGGTDSSSVAGYYGAVAGQPAKTFTIGFDEPGYNEMDFAHLAAQHFGTEQHDYYVTPEDVLALVEAIPELYDEPFGNSSVVPAYYCAKFARASGVEVLLAGDGGDEIFGGNERYVTNLVFEHYQRLPAFLRRGLLEPLLRTLPSLGPLHKAQRYVRRANMPNPERFFSYNLLAEYARDRVFQPDFAATVDFDAFLRVARAHWERVAPAHATDRLLYLDMKFTVTDNDLRKVTHMVEAAGIRVRYPLLDRDLVDFAATIPPTLKARPGRGRYMFKEAMQGFLPDAIIHKSKHGFGLPIAPWFKSKDDLRAILHDNLFQPDARLTEYIQPEFLQDMRRGFENVSTSYYGDNFWVFLMLELWLRSRG